VSGSSPLFLDRALQSGVDAIALPLALTGVSGRIDHLAVDLGRTCLLVSELDDAVLDVIGNGLGTGRLADCASVLATLEACIPALRPLRGDVAARPGMRRILGHMNA
jgi:hypothetical protein